MAVSNPFQIPTVEPLHGKRRRRIRHRLHRSLKRPAGVLVITVNGAGVITDVRRSCSPQSKAAQ